MILPWAAANASKPAGYLLCDGSQVSRSTYSALFSLVSTTYGSGDGSSTFNLPNLRLNSSAETRSPASKSSPKSISE